MSFVTGFLIGAMMVASALAYAFVSTTLVYRSTLFNGQTVYVKAVRS